MAKELERIDFSSGIRAEKIQNNFDALEEQLARERLAIAGHGISTGLDITIDKFDVEVREGSLIGHNGKEIFLESKTINIELPRLKSVTNETYLVEANGRITLPNIPYCLHRESAVNISSLQNGITITNYNNSGERIKLRGIRDNALTIDSSYSGSLVKISYSYTYKRYDTIYINLKGEIKVLEGTTSSAPSIVIPEDSMYILGYVEIDPFVENDRAEKVAMLKIKKDMRSLRNIFTDANNRLFICGIPFDNLQIIHMEQPAEPFINQLWYDAFSNKLKVWKELDNIEQWVNVNDISTIPVAEIKMWAPDEHCASNIDVSPNPADGQYFIFSPEEINLHYVPNRYALDIRIDQGILHKDQFEEVTLGEAKNNQALKEFLITKHGYTEEFINQIDDLYENIGVGFALATPLDKQCYVEVQVTHRLHENPLTHRFQRTATFKATNYYRVDSFQKVFTIDEYFRFKENQLEVYIGGDRLIPGLDFIEGLEAEYVYDDHGTLISPKQGKALNQFTIKKDIPNNSIVSYVVTSSIYSYDHVEQVVGDLSGKVDGVESMATEAKNIAQDVQVSTNQSINELKGVTAELQESNKEHSSFLKNSDKLTANNFSEDILAKLHKGFINKAIVKSTSQIVLLEGISPQDFIIAFDMSKTTGNNILKRIENDEPSGTGDYYIEHSAGQTKMHFKTASTVEIGSTLYLTGIKF